MLKTSDKVCSSWIKTHLYSLPASFPNEFFDKAVVYSKFCATLDSWGDSSAPGLDSIDYLIVTNLPIQLKLILTDMFNEIHTNDSYHESWSHFYIHFIKNLTIASLRPIARTFFVCKIYETMLKNWMQWWVESHDFLPVSQEGFMQGRSCTDCVTTLTL